VWWLSDGACGAKKQGESFMLFVFSFEVMLKEYTSVEGVNAFTSTMHVKVKQFGNIFYTLCNCINFISKNVSASLRV
jgi:hypothetical protein